MTLDKAIWLPREDQLRELLGDRFVALGRVDGGWRVTVDGSGGEAVYEAADAEDAYALALLSLA